MQVLGELNTAQKYQNKMCRSKSSCASAEITVAEKKIKIFKRKRIIYSKNVAKFHF